MQKLDNSYTLTKEEIRTMTIKDFKAGDFIYINKWIIQLDGSYQGVYFYEIIGKYNRHYDRYKYHNFPKYLLDFLLIESHR